MKKTIFEEKKKINKKQTNIYKITILGGKKEEKKLPFTKKKKKKN